MKEYFRTVFRRIVFPLPQDQEKQGFKPNFFIKFLRKLSAILVFLLRLNGENRFSNEFIQRLDPKLVVALPNHSKLVFRTGHGRLLWRARTLLTEEPLAIDWINQFVLNDCFYDVGANVGNYSLYAAKKGIRTFAVEPEYFNLSLLYENIFLNELQAQCTPLPIALGDFTHMDILHLKSISKGDALHSIGRKSYLIDEATSLIYRLNALVIRLDDLIQFFSLPVPSKLKIDVDSNEFNILKGASKTLDSVQEIYIELDRNFAEHKKAFNFLEEKSFKVIKCESIATKWNYNIANYLFRRS